MRLVAAGDRQIGTTVGQRAADFQTEPRAPTRDQRHPPLQRELAIAGARERFTVSVIADRLRWSGSGAIVSPPRGPAFSVASCAFLPRRA
jgi:hypothetical protein